MARRGYRMLDWRTVILSGFRLNRFTIQTYKDLRGLLAALIVSGFPTVVTILEQHRFVVQAVISLPDDVAPAVVGKLDGHVSRRKRRRLSVEAEISRGRFVAAFVEE